MKLFTCLRICDHSLCVNLYYFASLHIILGFFFKFTFILYKKLHCCVQDVPDNCDESVHSSSYDLQLDGSDFRNSSCCIVRQENKYFSPSLIVFKASTLVKIKLFLCLLLLQQVHICVSHVKSVKTLQDIWFSSKNNRQQINKDLPFPQMQSLLFCL